MIDDLFVSRNTYNALEAFKTPVTSQTSNTINFHVEKRCRVCDALHKNTPMTNMSKPFSALTTDEIDKINRCLDKELFSRTVDELELVHKVLYNIEFIQKHAWDLQHLICKNADRAFFPIGTTVFRKGQKGDAFFVVLSGRLVAEFSGGKSVEEDASTTIVLAPGSSFGDASLNNPDDIRKATVRALENTNLIRLSRYGYQRLLNANHIGQTDEVSWLQAVKNICCKPPIIRTEEEVEYLMGCLEGIEFLKETHVPLRRQLCRVMNFEHHPANSTVFKRGDLGNLFYIVLSGSVLVYTDISAAPVNTLIAGMSFGELALLNNISRSATVVCNQNTDFLTLSKQHYTAALGRLHQLDLQNNIRWFKNMFFTATPRSEHVIAPLVAMFEKRHYKPGETIATHGQNIDEVAFVLEGQCSCSLQLKLKKKEGFKTKSDQTVQVRDVFAFQSPSSRSKNPNEKNVIIEVGEMKYADCIGMMELSAAAKSWKTYMWTIRAVTATTVVSIPLTNWHTMPYSAIRAVYCASALKSEEMRLKIADELRRYEKEGFGLEEPLRIPIVVPNMPMDTSSGTINIDNYYFRKSLLLPSVRPSEHPDALIRPISAKSSAVRTVSVPSSSPRPSASSLSMFSPSTPNNSNYNNNYNNDISTPTSPNVRIRLHSPHPPPSPTAAVSSSAPASPMHSLIATAKESPRVLQIIHRHRPKTAPKLEERVVARPVGGAHTARFSRSKSWASVSESKSSVAGDKSQGWITAPAGFPAMFATKHNYVLKYPEDEEGFRHRWEEEHDERQWQDAYEEQQKRIEKEEQEEKHEAISK